MSSRKAWLLRWRDHNFSEGAIEDIYGMGDYVMTSVGFLVGEDHDWYYLAQSFNNDDTPCEVLRVMKATVVSRSPLWEEQEGAAQ